MQIGLIGGIGPAATDYYYRRLISEFAKRGVALEMTIVHADTPTLLSNLEANDVDAQLAIYNRLTERLASAGAQCVVVSSIAGHFCIDPFKEGSALPVIDMLMEVDNSIEAKGLERVGIIGTRTVMETRFYSGVSTAEVVPPSDSTLEHVHAAYVAMAAAGQVTNRQREVFDSACQQLIQESNVEAVMLGGTDLALAYPEDQKQFPLVDCAAIHVDAIIRHAISE